MVASTFGRRNPSEPHDGVASHGAFRANRHCYRPGQGLQRHLGRERNRVSRPDANRNAGDGNARCGGAGHRHNPHSGVRSIRGGVPGGHPMISEKAMLAAVHISIWTAVKHDRKVSRDVADQHGAHQGAGRYNKQLLRGADKLEELRTVAGQIRQHFYKITLPWSDEGYRLLPAHFYFELTTQMREFERAFSQSVEEFLEVYPSYIEQVRPELNGLFREEDYPSAEKLRTMFGVKLEVLPIPNGDDFRVTLSEEEHTRVAREIDESVRQSLNRGTKDLWVRLTDVVTHMVDKLNEPESRFHASLVTNVFDLVDLLPRLNVNQDEELNRFAAEIKGRLCNFSAHDLKKNEILRAAAASDAAQILSQMDAVLRGREQDSVQPNDKSTQQSTPGVDEIFSHMSAYMEATTQ